MYKFLCERMLSILLCYVRRSRIVGSYVKRFEELPDSSKLATPLYIPTSMYEDSNFSCVLDNTCYYVFLIIGTLVGVKQ